MNTKNLSISFLCIPFAAMLVSGIAFAQSGMLDEESHTNGYGGSPGWAEQDVNTTTGHSGIIIPGENEQGSSTIPRRISELRIDRRLKSRLMNRAIKIRN